MQTRIYDPKGQEIIGWIPIWADRLAIFCFLITGGLLGAVYAVAGDPGSFVLCEEISIAVCAMIWFVGRAFDWLLTGRIR